jgi:hypothetical protein
MEFTPRSHCRIAAHCLRIGATLEFGDVVSKLVIIVVVVVVVVIIVVVDTGSIAVFTYILQEVIT